MRSCSCLSGLSSCFSQLRLSFAILGPVGRWLDSLPSHDWHQSLSLLSLRLISFNMDYYWKLKEKKSDSELKDFDYKSRRAAYHLHPI